MGYRKIDPRTKAAAIKAMRKAIDEDGQSAYAAARELSAKYHIGATTLNKYFAETQQADEPEPELDAEPAAEIIEHDEIAEPVVVETTTITTAVAAARHNNAAGLLSAEFTSTLEALSGEFVARLQEAALDDLIRKMQELRDSLRR
jgi:hypothetical protein